MHQERPHLRTRIVHPQDQQASARQSDRPTAADMLSPWTRTTSTTGDNLEVLKKHIADESVDLIYLDPPFNSARNYNVIFNRHDTKDDASAQIEAFEDTWTWTPTTDQQYQEYVNGGLPPKVADALTAMRTLLGENDASAYLVNMAPRLVELHRVLKPRARYIFIATHHEPLS